MLDWFSVKSTVLTRTTKLSNQLNLSLKYCLKPIPVILRISSRQKTEKKAILEYSKNFSVSSSMLNLSNARTNELAMMHVTINTVNTLLVDIFKHTLNKKKLFALISSMLSVICFSTFMNIVSNVLFWLSCALNLWKSTSFSLCFIASCFNWAVMLRDMRVSFSSSCGGLSSTVSSKISMLTWEYSCSCCSICSFLNSIRWISFLIPALIYFKISDSLSIPYSRRLLS